MSLNRSRSLAGFSKAPRNRRARAKGKSLFVSVSLRIEQLEDRCLLSSSSWTEAVVPVPFGIGTMMLLPDGSVMAQQAGESNAWYRLTPDSSGSYATGSWTQAGSMNFSRLYFGSNVLPNDKLFLVGGEYSNATTTTGGSLTNTAEMYDMATNTWSNIASVPSSLVGTWSWSEDGQSSSGTPFGDDPSVVLPDGKILAGFIFSGKTLIYDPAANTWSLGPTKLRNDRSDEETWVKLPNGNILSYDVFTSSPSAQMFVPAANPTAGNEGQWVDAGTPPVSLTSSAVEFELGPASLLPDGDVFFEGATGHTALYHYQTNTWTQGPDILSPTGALMGADDAPAAVLPNGNVLFTADSVSIDTYSPPTAIFDYDPGTNTITQVAGLADMILSAQGSYVDRMLVLPNGQVAFTVGDYLRGAVNGVSFPSALFFFTPSGAPASTWRPSVGNIVSHGGGSFTLTGVQLNGISEGASYGDDAEMSENYPIVQFRSLTGNVYYATSSNWTSEGVQTGSQTVSTNFQLPAGFVAGTYYVTVSAAGISSVPRLLYVGASDVPPAGTPAAPLGAPVGSGTSMGAGLTSAMSPGNIPEKDDAESTGVELDANNTAAAAAAAQQFANPANMGMSYNSGIAATDAVFSNYSLYQYVAAGR